MVVTGEVYVGRGVELDRVAARLQAAAGGRSGVVWVEGAAGAGKSAFARQVIGAAPDNTIVRWVGAEEVAQDVSFALTDQLGVAHDGHPFSTGLRLLEAITAHGDGGVSLLVVEDLQWADVASRQALLAAARRLDADSVVMMVTTRPAELEDVEGWSRFAADSPLVTRIVLEALTPDEVIELAERRGLRLSPRRAAEVHAHTLGQPLQVQLVLDELSPQLLADAGAPLPIPRSVAATAVGRLRAASEPAQRLAEALAVLNRRTPLAVAAAVGEVTDAAAALDPLLAGGLVTWAAREAGTPVRFAHPLFQLAVYESMPPARRQRLHREASKFADEAASLAHRAAAADGFDDALADDLEAAAHADVAAGRQLSAGTHLLSASVLTLRRETAEDRLLRAAQYFLDDEQPGRITAVHDRVLSARPSGRRSLVLGTLAWQRGDAAAAETHLTRATTAGDSDVAVAAWARLSALWDFHERYEEALRAGEAIVALRPSDQAVERQGWRAIAVGDGGLNGPAHALARLAERLPSNPELVADADVSLLTWRAMITSYSGQINAPLADLRRVIQASTHRTHPRTHLHLSQTLHRAGAWDEAMAQGRAARSVAADASMLWMLPLTEAALARILIERGDPTGMDHLAAARTALAQAPTLEASATLAFTQAAAAFARFEPHQVISQLAPFSDADAAGALNPLLPVEWWPSLVIARLDLGDLVGAERERERFQQAAGRRGVDLAPGLADVDARIAAATHHPNALDAFDSALRLAADGMPALERALLYQAHGEALYHIGHRREAIEQLRIADEQLGLLGALPFRARVGAVLKSRGDRTPRTRAQRRVTLTERERDVAALVATGMTNKEVGASLYLSSKAVEYHLRNIFTKFGLQSRRELRQRRAEFELATT